MSRRRQLRNVLVCAALASGAGNAFALEAFVACPGNSYTLDKKRNVNRSYRICYKTIGIMDGTPSKAEVWFIRDGSLTPSKTLSGEFCESTGAALLSEFKLGAVDKPTAVYWNIRMTDLGLAPKESEAGQLAELKPLGPSPTGPFPALNPCVAVCKQTPPPKSDRRRQDVCLWHCGNAGTWVEVCSDTPKKGKRDID